MSCIFCKSNDLEKIWFNKYSIPLENQLEEFEVLNVICKQCGLIFQNPQLSEAEMNNLYKHQYRLDVNNETAFESRINQYNFFMQNIDKKVGSILDIGCGEGYFLSFFSEWEKFGVEPSSTAVERANKNYEDENIICGFYEDVKYDEKQFDCISIRHVLEHVKNLEEILKKIRYELKDDGCLYVEVPNVYQCVDLGDITDFFGYQHLYQFSSKTLENILNKYGFKVIKSEIVKKYPAIRVISVKGNILCNYENDYNNFVSNFKSALDSKLKIRNDIKKLLDKKNILWKQDKKDVYIYGAGMHTEELIKFVNFLNYNVVGLIDKNKAKQGENIFGYKVYSENIIKNLKNSIIIISSYAFQEEIYNEFKKYDSNIELIKLYDKINMLPYLS